jgi:hypothetical protein
MKFNSENASCMNRKEDSGKKITFINKNISAGIFMKEKNNNKY